jgi:hypothetical protein
MTQTFRQPVKFATPVGLPKYTVANVPSAVDNEGAVIYVSDGNVGVATVAFSNNTDWLVVTTGLAIAAS